MIYFKEFDSSFSTPTYSDGFTDSEDENTPRVLLSFSGRIAIFKKKN
jgi:hypothetical protein